MSLYPDAIDGFEQLPLIVDGITPVNAFSVNALRQAILNLEIELGITPSGDYTTVSERLDGMDFIIENGVPPDIEARILVLEAAVADLEAKVVILEGNITTIEADIIALEGDVLVLQGDITTLDGQVLTLQGDVTTLDGQVLTVQGDITTLDGQVLTLQGDVTTLDTTTTNLGLQLDAIVDNLGAYTNDASAVAVGDAVFQVAGVDNKVDIADADNASARPSLGVVVELTDTTNCIVCHAGGTATGLSGLTRGTSYWLSNTGTTGNTLSASRPVSDAYLVGVAVSATEMLVSTLPADIAGGGGGGGTTAVTQTNAVYFSKAGDDLDSGLTKDDPVLTIGAAIIAANTLIPTTSNRIVIIGQDAGIYSEANSFPDYVSLYAPGITITNNGTQTLGVESDITVARVLCGGGGSTIEVTTAGKRSIKANYIAATGTFGDYGLLVNHASAEVNVDIGTVFAAGIVVTGAMYCQAGRLTGRVGYIEADAHAVKTNTSGEADLIIGKVYSTGGQAFVASAGTMNIVVGEIVSTTKFSVGGSGTINISVMTATGATGTITGTLNYEEPTIDLLSENKVYVSKVGDDANSGFHIEKPKLTIASALTAASTLSPTNINPVVVNVESGYYSGSFSLPDYVDLFAPDVIVTNGITMGAGCTLTIHEVRVPSGGGNAVVMSTAGERWINADLIHNPGISGSHSGIYVNHASVVCHLNIGKINLAAGAAVRHNTSGESHGFIGHIEASNGASNAVELNGATAFCSLHVATIDVAGTAADINTSGAILNLVCGRFEAATNWGIVAGATVNTFVTEMGGGSFGTVGGTLNLTEAGGVQTRVWHFDSDVPVSPNATIDVKWFAATTLTVTDIKVYAKTSPSTAGTYTLAASGDGNNLLSTATYDLTGLTADTLTGMTLTATGADLNLIEGDVVDFTFASNNADLTATEVYIQMIYEVN